MSTSDHSISPDSGAESATSQSAEDLDQGSSGKVISDGDGAATGAVPPKDGKSVTDSPKARPARKGKKTGNPSTTDGEADRDADDQDSSTTEAKTKSKAKAKDKDKDTGKDTDATSATEGTKKRTRRGSRPQAVPGLNPSWWAPVMCTLMVVGLLWIVVFYLLSDGTKDTWPIPGIGYGNLAIGFGLIMAGFLMTTRWK